MPWFVLRVWIAPPWVPSCTAIEFVWNRGDTCMNRWATGLLAAGHTCASSCVAVLSLEVLFSQGGLCPRACGQPMSCARPCGLF